MDFPLQCQVGGSPVYIVERKLGKGGFGQVYVGRRAQQTTAKDGPNANFVSLDCRHTLLWVLELNAVLLRHYSHAGAAALSPLAYGIWYAPLVIPLSLYSHCMPSLMVCAACRLH